MDRDGLDLTPVITHRFPLDRWAQAVLTVKNARQTGAVKVLLEPSRCEGQRGNLAVIGGWFADSVA